MTQLSFAMKPTKAATSEIVSTRPSTRTAAGVNVLTPVRDTIGTTDSDCAGHPAALTPSSLMGSTWGLEALPLEILQEVIQLLVPVNQILSVRYSHLNQPRNGPHTRDATSLMLSSQTNYEATVPML
jgi:hypothetical protein